ncbi:MAG: UvrD-helicase domain-containing protein [Candidatus Auribacterota bacterium]
MKYITDFHIHSHYSLATSRKLVPEHLEYWALLKGISVVGTGDCIHPGWFNELKDKFTPAGNGLYSLKDEFRLDETRAFSSRHPGYSAYFMLTTEISSIYKKNGKVRKVHNVCVFPDFESAGKVQAKLASLGNIASDGRPILGLDSRDLAEIVYESGDRAFVIPAHIWTPWFSVLGSKSGFDSIDECYEDMTQHIFAVETGLSSDPPMNRACSILDRFQLVSNSDAHSPEKLGREANLFDTELSFKAIYDALKTGNGFLGTIEFFPQEGKYFYDGHRKCSVCWDPLQTISHGGLCSQCGKPVTCGVMYRVAELADRANPEDAPIYKDFHSITSLPDILAEVTGKKSTAKAVNEAYFNTLNTLGSEFQTLLFTPLSDIENACGPVLAEAIRRLRDREVYISEGYDGEFGHITVFKPDEINGLNTGALFGSDKPAATLPVRPKSSILFDINAFKEYKPIAEIIQEPKKKEQSKQITAQQSDAIAFGEGVCLVIAGPGAGKTHILTSRIVSLIKDKNVPPEEILAITFSNKAAQEMRDRVEKQLPGCTAAISTFHSFGLSIVRNHLSLCGRQDGFQIIDEEDKQAIFNLMCESPKESKTMIRLMSAFKNGILNDDLPAELINNYAAHLRKINAFDLDDLIYVPVRLMTAYPSLIEQYTQKYRWILIDEYQDINRRQYELIRFLTDTPSPNLFAIGDPDQAIYGFRGSDVTLIRQLTKDYPQTETITLDKSYRCPEPILKAAGQVLQHKNYLIGTPDDVKITLFECATDTAEADRIAGQIERMIGGVRSFSINSGMSDGEEYQDIQSFSDFAVLCRTAHMFDAFITAFENHGIAYQVVSSTPFFMREPLYSVLKSLKHLYFIEEGGISQESVEISSDDIVRQLIENNAPLRDILDVALRHEGIDENDRIRLKSMAEPFGTDYTSFFASLMIREGLDEYDKQTEAVSLMTLHASKGLEFQAVFIPGCENNIIPFEIFGKKTDTELAEEERLFYVGATRSKKYLFLSCAQRRMLRNRVLNQSRSYLLDRVEQELLKNEKRPNRYIQKNEQLSLFS